jgi:hypothetical protein
MTLQIHPQPENEYQTLVTIPYSRIRHHRQYAAPNQDGFTVTQLVEATFEGVTTLVKDETRNVSGSHKARHLFGTLLELRLAGADDATRPLATALCGNAALAAAVVAQPRSANVFVPTDADQAPERPSAGARSPHAARPAQRRGDPTVCACARRRRGAGPSPQKRERPGDHGGPTLGRLADQWRALGCAGDQSSCRSAAGRRPRPSSRRSRKPRRWR